MHGPRLRTKRMLRLMAAGVLCLIIWLLTLRIQGSAVFYDLERFAVHDDARYLLAAATILVGLNTLRAVFLYLGWFNLGECLSCSSRQWKSLSWMVPLVAIPSSYLLVSKFQDGLTLHFGLPALFSIATVLILHLATEEISGRLHRYAVIALLVMGFQWLDLAPSLSRWGFGGGELSIAVKDFAEQGEWGWVLDGMALGLFLAVCAGGAGAAALLVGANNLNAQFRKIRARDQEIAALREEAIRVRGYQEIQQLVHDLKRPLTTILGLADVMTETLPMGPPLQYARQIAATGANMNQMVEELLKEKARQTLPVGTLLGYVQSQISAFPWRHMVTVELEKHVSEHLIQVNLIRFSRAMVNVLHNAHLAVQNKDCPRIVLGARIHDEALHFTISDNGKGFAENFTSTQWGFSQWGSTGIGLAFVEETVKNHGGALLIANQPDGGAQVTLCLPL